MAPEEDSDPLADFPIARSPPRLLRFFSPKGLSLLTRGHLRLTPPNEFNDPFEFCAAIPTTLPLEVDRMRWLRDANGFLYASHKQNHSDDYETWAALALKQGMDFWSAMLRNLCLNYAKAVSHAYGVCCFMELADREFTDPEIVHFWDRYAAGHHGFAVEFNPRAHLFDRYRKERWLFPVSYKREDQRSVIDPDKLTTDCNSMLRYLRKIAAEKFETWKSEHEWRLIAPLKESEDFPITMLERSGKSYFFLDLSRIKKKKVPFEAIASVYLGCRACKLKECVLAACSEPRLAHVSVFQAKPSDHDFTFSYKRLK
ncbi:MAG TPA: DUF2971 domain-containing protein [Opitutaceae bacterium]